MRYELVYSPDDGGWYASEFPSGRTTAVYRSKSEARESAEAGNWE
jgi:hypothetical protein